jgi:ribosomal protein S18 acetylase RimI-like enzyme
MFAVSVVPQWRGRGLGTMLVDAGMQMAVESGCRFIYLDVEPQSPAIKLYRRLGLTALWRRVTYSLT